MQIKKEQKIYAKDKRKQQLVLCALKVFCEKGYENASVDDIAKKANCSHGLFYHYFKNKREILDSVLAVKHNNSFDDIKKELEKETSYRGKLNIILKRLFSNLTEDETAPYYFYFFVSQTFISKSKGKLLLPPNADKDKIIKYSPYTAIKEFFLEGQKNGEIKDDIPPEEGARLFMSIVQGATLGYVIAPKEIQKNMKLPNVNYILDIFCKEKLNENKNA